MTRIRGDLCRRSFELAVRIVSLIDDLPAGTKGWELGRQLLRSGTSIGANVREADEAISDADFAYRCSVARKEAAETHYWLLLCKRSGLLNCHDTIQEVEEQIRILSTIVQRIQSPQASK